MCLTESFLCLSHTEVRIGPLFQFPGCHQSPSEGVHGGRASWQKTKFSAGLDAQNTPTFYISTHIGWFPNESLG